MLGSKHYLLAPRPIPPAAVHTPHEGTLWARGIEGCSTVRTKVDGMQEPCGTCCGTESGKASWAFRAIQIPQAGAQDDESNYKADFTWRCIAEPVQRYPQRDNDNADSTQLQCTPGAALEVVTDRLSHSSSRPNRSRTCGWQNPLMPAYTKNGAILSFFLAAARYLDLHKSSHRRADGDRSFPAPPLLPHIKKLDDVWPFPRSHNL